MGEEQSLASSNPDSTKASKRDISMGSCALPRSRTVLGNEEPIADRQRAARFEAWKNTPQA